MYFEVFMEHTMVVTAIRRIGSRGTVYIYSAEAERRSLSDSSAQATDDIISHSLPRKQPCHVQGISVHLDDGTNPTGMIDQSVRLQEVEPPSSVQCKRDYPPHHSPSLHLAAAPEAPDLRLCYISCD